jgi:thioredoxin-like negative regulator of GroEL
MAGLTLSLLLQTSLLAAGPNDYGAAYRETQVDGQPLLVLVGADWCPGCITMKQAVLPRLGQSGKLQNVNVALVNTDAQSDLAGQLMRGGTIPQLVVFAKTSNGWHREQITGAVNEATVEAMLHRARQAQVASTTATQRHLVEASGR